MEGLFKSLALQHMPANMQNIDRKKSGKAPPSNNFALLSKESCPAIWAVLKLALPHVDCKRAPKARGTLAKEATKL